MGAGRTGRDWKLGADNVIVYGRGVGWNYSRELRGRMGLDRHLKESLVTVRMVKGKRRGGVWRSG